MSAWRMSAVGLAAAMVAAGSAAWAASGPYTAQQADDGHVKFNNHCAQCHGPKLIGALGPNLKDDKFKAHWAGKPVKELRGFIWENMPQTAPKSLSDDQLDPIVAWILKNNDVAPGDKPLDKASAETAEFPKK